MKIGQASVLAAAGLCLAGAAMAETRLERGEHLVRTVAACGNRHTPSGPQGPDMSRELGGRMVEENAQFTAWAPNITPGPERGIGAWTDHELPLPPSHGPPVAHVADMPRGPTAEYGAYLAGPVAHCRECRTTFGPHGPMLDSHLGYPCYARMTDEDAAAIVAYLGTPPPLPDPR